jgi:hypothetical protein
MIKQPRTGASQPPRSGSDKSLSWDAPEHGNVYPIRKIVQSEVDHENNEVDLLAEVETQNEKVAPDSGDDVPDLGVGGGETERAPLITRPRERAPIPTKIASALRRDVIYIRVPKSDEQRAKDAARPARRKAVSLLWRTRRSAAPVYGFAAEAIMFGTGPVELYGPVTAAVALLWWRKVWRRYGVRVDLRDVRGVKPRFLAWRNSRRFVKRWPETARDVNLVGVKPRTMIHDAWSVSVNVSAPPKYGIPEIRKVLPNLERALDANRDASRVGAVPGDKRAKSVQIRVMTSDPHAAPLAPLPYREITQDYPYLPIGMFETAELVELDLKTSAMVAGQTGAGKSMILQNIIRGASRIEWLAVVLLDLGAGGTEFGPWRGKVECVGQSIEDAQVIISCLLAEKAWRGERMAETGAKNWKCSPEHPHVLFVIDEVQVMTEDGEGDLLLSVAAEGRKFGFTIVVATQDPTAKSLPPKVKRNCPQVIGGRVSGITANESIFDKGAASEGWNAARLPENTFLIRSRKYRDPMQAKAFFLSETEQEQMITTAPAAVRVHRGNPDHDLRLMLDQVVTDEPAPLGAPRVRLDRKGKSAAAVWSALPEDGAEIHRKQIEAATGLSQKTCDERLKELLSQGRIENPAAAIYCRAA